MTRPGTYLLILTAAAIFIYSCSQPNRPSTLSDEYSYSPYNKNVNFGEVPSTYYIGRQEDYSFGDARTRTSAILERFDQLVDGSYMTRQTIGKASDDSEMIMYRLTSGKKGGPKFIIICAQHGFEKNSIYGTYYFLRDLKERYMDDEVLRYFRENAEFIVIPCANPYAVDTREYFNANGVNLNRNWPVNDWTSIKEAKPGQSEYGGESEGDQPETRNIIEILSANNDALLVMDFHTNGSGTVEKGKLNWLSMTLNDDPYREQLLTIGKKHLDRISSFFEITYPDEIGNENTLCGYMDWVHKYSKTGYLSTYAAQQDFLSLTFEGFNGFPNDKVFSDKAKKANSELLGNYLITLCEIYSSELLTP